MQIEYHRKFIKHFERLSHHLKQQAVEKEAIFRANWRDLRLRTHKLSGRLVGYLALSVNFEYRIIFEIVTEDLVRFYDIGRHNIYD